MQDKIIKVLKDLREILLQKRSSLVGTVANQATKENQDRIQVKINDLTDKISEVNDCITLRMSEINSKGSPHVPLD